MDQQQAALEGWLRFNDEDITFNRDSRLSPRQRRGLLWSAAWRLALGLTVAVFAALSALTLGTGIEILVTLVAICFGLYAAWRGFAFLVDATSGAVAFVTAPLNTRMSRGRSVSYFVNVGPIQKVIRARAFASIRPGGTYHLYYAPGCRSLLSLEPASVTEPIPAHPFGPDSAHAWDRLRWSWILLTIGAFGAILGVHQVVTAHPAVPVTIAGVVQDYEEEHTSGRGAHTIRTIFLAGDGTNYTPDQESAYTPEAPDYYSLIGKSVILYVNQGTTDVIALSDGDTTYEGDWYMHPEHETTFLIVNGALTIGIAVFFLVLGTVLMLRDRRLAEEMPGRSAVYMPPTVHPVNQMWVGVGVVTGILVFIGLGVAAVK